MGETIASAVGLGTLTPEEGRAAQRAIEDVSAEFNLTSEEQTALGGLPAFIAEGGPAPGTPEFTQALRETAAGVRLGFSPEQQLGTAQGAADQFAGLDRSTALSQLTEGAGISRISDPRAFARAVERSNANAAALGLDFADIVAAVSDLSFTNVEIGPAGEGLNAILGRIRSDLANPNSRLSQQGFTQQTFDALNAAGGFPAVVQGLYSIPGFDAVGTFGEQGRLLDQVATPSGGRTLAERTAQITEGRNVIEAAQTAIRESPGEAGRDVGSYFSEVASTFLAPFGRDDVGGFAGAGIAELIGDVVEGTLDATLVGVGLPRRFVDPAPGGSRGEASVVNNIQIDPTSDIDAVIRELQSYETLTNESAVRIVP